MFSKQRFGYQFSKGNEAKFLPNLNLSGLFWLWITILVIFLIVLFPISTYFAYYNATSIDFSKLKKKITQFISKISSIETINSNNTFTNYLNDSELLVTSQSTQTTKKIKKKPVEYQNCTNFQKFGLSYSWEAHKYISRKFHLVPNNPCDTEISENPLVVFGIISKWDEVGHRNAVCHYYYFN